MKRETEAQLDLLLTTHTKARRQSDDEKNARDRRETDFTEEFVRLRRSVIKPAMEEFGAGMAARGYSFAIAIEDGHIRAPADRAQPKEPYASIAMTLLGLARVNPILIVQGHHSDQRVHFLQGWTVKAGANIPLVRLR